MELSTPSDVFATWEYDRIIMINEFFNHNQSQNHPAPVLFPKDTWKHKSRVVAIPLIALLIVGALRGMECASAVTQTMKKEFPCSPLRSFEQRDYQGAYQLIAVAQERYPKSAELRFIRAMVILEEGLRVATEQFLSVAKNTETIPQSISNEGARVSGFHNMLGMALLRKGKQTRRWTTIKRFPSPLLIYLRILAQRLR